ncbi:MAG TPA: phage tail protein [Pilimelia sp.]|nr:phage tail protein [Pilimelia sp.]
MRTAVPGLPTPYPIGEALPAMYQEDEFVQRFVAGLDEVLAPVLLTLDCLDAYLDPALAPADFLDWLAGWLAVPVDDTLPVARRRDLVGQAARLHRWRGTAAGLAAEVRLLTGGEVTVTDTGGATASTTAGASPPEPAAPHVRVVVRVADPAAVAPGRVRDVVAAAVPAHVRVTVEVEASP